MSKGRTFELDTVREITAATDSDHVWSSALDYSGGAADSDADIEVLYHKSRDVVEFHLLELKKRQGKGGNRVIVMEGGGGDETGREELTRLVDAGPSWARSWLAIKFDHRALVVVPATWVYEQVVDAPDELPTDYRKRNEVPSEAAQRYVRRTSGPYYWEPTDEIERLAPRLTDADSLSMVKPSLEWWDSSTAGDSNVEILLDTLDVPEHFIK
jgi:hypothetical protein